MRLIKWAQVARYLQFLQTVKKCGQIVDCSSSVQECYYTGKGDLFFPVVKSLGAVSGFPLRSVKTIKLNA